MGLPVIDISGLVSPNRAARVAAGAEMRAANLAHGFFYCTGHGIPQGLIDTVIGQTGAFFGLTETAKDALDMALSPANRGQTLQPGALPDRKEGFCIAEDLPRDHPRVQAGEFNAGPDLWPDDLPALRPVLMACHAARAVPGKGLTPGLALSLDLPEDHFRAFTTQASATVRSLHYPPGHPDARDEMGAGAHTDLGGLTILMQDEVGGLQVCDPDSGDRIEAAPVPDAFVVNPGDMIARWSNNRYRSTLHRVINRPGRERDSVPFFHTGNFMEMVACIPTCLAPREAPKSPPIRLMDHIRAMYAKTYG